MSITEDELKERASGPRVTLDQVNETIVSEFYFTARDGVLGELGSDGVKPTPYERANCSPTLGLLTFCVLVLKNGFTVTGQSACADPSNYKKDIGDRIAKADAVNKIWPLLGYELRTKLASALTGAPTPITWLDRARQEYMELSDRRDKLLSFLKSGQWSTLSKHDKYDLRNQYMAMWDYLTSLGRRIDRADLAAKESQ